MTEVERQIAAFLALEKAARYLCACQRDPDIATVGQRLERWLAFDDEELTLDQILQVSAPGAGKRTLRTVIILARRDDAVRAAVAFHFPNVPVAQQSRDFHQAWQRYAAGGWRRERALDHPPEHRAGTIEASIWEIMRLRDHVISERSIRGILSTNGGYSLPSETSILCEVEKLRVRVAG